ncbi:MAG: hypothetical protein IKN54_03735 [Lachnospiraceae bacterium]|nr:hypothetical protein [Lachnospiraceae bacterium]
MRDRMQTYLDYMEEISKKELTEEETQIILTDFFNQIRFFQNERLIHLIVTVTFAIMALMSMLANLMIVNIPMLIFSLGTLIFLFFYIRHYFFLERGVQKLYTYYDLFVKNNFTNKRK